MNNTTVGFAGYPKQQSAATKNVHYHSDGTGRDSYIHVDQGGYMSNFAAKAVNDRYVANLRQYDSSVQGHQRTIVQQSRLRQGLSPLKDFFVEGQVSIRSPRARRTLAAASGYQKASVERLSIPKDLKRQFADMQSHNIPSGIGSSPSRDYLRSSREMNFTTNKGEMMTNNRLLDGSPSP